MKIINPLKTYKIEDLTSGRNIIKTSAGMKGNLLILSLKQEPDYVTTPPNGFLKMWADKPNNFRIHSFKEDVVETIDLEETRENFIFIQPLPNNNWLLARGQSKTEHDKNAVIFSKDGRFIRSFPIGDGINSVQTTYEGQIWVSYSDIGVFSQKGIGNSGLVCFDQFGKILFKYDDFVKKVKLPYIIDCYGLNVSSNKETWLYYYDDFPLVCLINKESHKIWNNIYNEMNCFAVDKDYVLFAQNCYSKRDKSSLLSVSLKTMKRENVKPFDSNGKLIIFNSSFARGSRFFLKTEKYIFKMDMRTL